MAFGSYKGGQAAWQPDREGAANCAGTRRHCAAGRAAL